MITPDPETGGIQLVRTEFGVGATNLPHGGGLGDRDIIKSAQRTEYDPGEKQPLMSRSGTARSRKASSLTRPVNPATETVSHESSAVNTRALNTPIAAT